MPVEDWGNLTRVTRKRPGNIGRGVYLVFHMRSQKKMFKFPPNSYFFVFALASSLLLFGCGAEETVNPPLGVIDKTPTPTSPRYFPITLGSRWTYRSPDGSEWSREVDESHNFDTELHHSFSYNPPIELDSIRSPEYLTYIDRMVRRINLKDFNDAIWNIILKSGGESPTWTVGMHCNKDMCQINKDIDIFEPPGILTLLFQSHPRVAWHSELIPLKFPLSPDQTYTALNLRLSGRGEIFTYMHVFYADAIIVTTIGNARKLVETPAGTFQDCLKIQYEAEQTSFTTVQFTDAAFPHIEPTAAKLKAVNSTLRDELTDLLAYLMPKLGLQTMWLAPGVGPVKIETPDGIAELIDYEIKPAE